MRMCIHWILHRTTTNAKKKNIVSQVSPFVESIAGISTLCSLLSRSLFSVVPFTAIASIHRTMMTSLYGFCALAAFYCMYYFSLMRRLDWCLNAFSSRMMDGIKIQLKIHNKRELLWLKVFFRFSSFEWCVIWSRFDPKSYEGYLP